MHRLDTEKFKRPIERTLGDHRVYTYFGIPEGKELKYNVMLNAAYACKYYLPATLCEAMYNKSISALLKGQWVEVVR